MTMDAPLLAEFPREEYLARLSEFQAALAADQVDAVLIADEATYRYFAGHFTETWQNKSRPSACWIPASGEPILVVCDVEVSWARATSWCTNVRGYAGPSVGPGRIGDAYEVGYEPDITVALVSAARELGLGPKSRVGSTLGGRSRVDLPLEVLRNVADQLGVGDVSDVAPAVWRSRMVKSDLELTVVARAVAALDRAFDRLFAELQEGMSESKMARSLRIGMLEGEADTVGYTNAVSDVRRGVFSSPTRRELRRGDLAYVDGGAVSGGYYSDYCRMFACGAPSPPQRDAYRVMTEALSAGAEAIRAGTTAGTVAGAVYGVFEEAGHRPAMGRVGHGNGLAMPEPPSLHPRDETLLQAGMVLCLEPNLEVPGVGTLVVEDDFVVTETGAVNLSRRPTPMELPTIGTS